MLQIRPPYHWINMSYEGEGKASIKIDGKEYCRDGRGINVVVYEYEYMEMADSVTLTVGEDGNIVIERD